MASKKLTVPTVVTIYSPKGKPEPHTRANARDLVNGAGYTWDKRKESNPAAYAPFALPQNTKFSKSKAQEVLDRVGAAAPGTDADGEEVFDGVDDGSATGPISLPADNQDEDEAEEEAPAAAPVKKPRKQRQKPNPAPEQEEVEGIEET